MSSGWVFFTPLSGPHLAMTFDRNPIVGYKAGMKIVARASAISALVWLNTFHEFAAASPFQTEPVIAPLVSDYYDSGACFFSLLVPIDLNFDGKKDLLAHYWCNDWSGEVAPAPTLDALMVYLVGEDGALSVGNQSVFGSDALSLGGATRNYVKGDFNGDGTEDVAFAVNWEDGRPQSDGTSWDTQQTVVLSNGDAFEIVRVGDPVWGHGIGATRNELGYEDVLSARRNPWGGINLFPFRWRDGEFEEAIALYPDVTGMTVGGVTTQEMQGGAGDYYTSSDSGGIKYHQRLANSWLSSELGGINKEHIETATYITWNGDTGNFIVSELDGSYYLNLDIADSCYLEATSGLAGYVVGKFTGRMLGESYDLHGTYYEGDLPLINKLVFFEVTESGVLTSETPLLEEFVTDFFNFFTCRDLNGDGLVDIAVHDQTGQSRPYSGGAPRTYLRLPNGKFKHLPTDDFPKGIEDGSQIGIYADLDSDGIQDLILYNTDPQIALRVHYGNSYMELGVENPFPPQVVSHDYGDGTITLFLAVAYDGGTNITGYEATCTDGTNTFTGTSTSSPITVSGLTNDVAYICTVTATNSVGTSSASAATDPITPEALSTGLPIWLLYQATQ